MPAFLESEKRDMKYEIQKLNLNPVFIAVRLYWLKTKPGAHIHKTLVVWTLDLHLDLSAWVYIYQQWGNYHRKLKAPTHKSAASKNNKEELFKCIRNKQNPNNGIAPQLDRNLKIVSHDS